jgi:hypothetical protein
MCISSRAFAVSAARMVILWVAVHGEISQDNIILTNYSYSVL